MSTCGIVALKHVMPLVVVVEEDHSEINSSYQCAMDTTQVRRRFSKLRGDETRPLLIHT